MKRIISILLALTLIGALCIASASAAEKIPMDEDAAVDILISYRHTTFTASQQKQYQDGDWTVKMATLEECYAASKTELLGYIGTICDYRVLRDTTINRIYLRVPSSAVEKIKKSDYVKSVSYTSPPDSKLDEEAQKLVDEEDPRIVVNVHVWTDRADVSAMRDYLDIGKNEMNAMFAAEDEEGVSEWVKVSHAYYAEHNRRLVKEITEKTDAVYHTAAGVLINNGVWTELDLLWCFDLEIPVGQLEILNSIDGIATVNYIPKHDVNRMDAELIDVIAADPEQVITVAVECKAAPLTIEDMPAYNEGDKESYVTARRQLAEVNRERNDSFIGELAEYAAFDVKSNTITTIVVLSLRAGDIYDLADCDSVRYIEYVAEGAYHSEAGIERLTGDVDGDNAVTILDSTGIQRELVGLSSPVFDRSCADYDADGAVTILDATGIQRTLAGLS